MRSRRSGSDQVAEVARRRLEQLSAELAGLRLDAERLPPDQPAPPVSRRDGPAEDPVDGPPPTGPARGASAPAPVPGASGSVPGRHAHRSVGPVRLAAGWLQDRLPVLLHGRVQVGGAHVAAVAVLALSALAVTGWVVLRADRGEVTGASDGRGDPASAAAPALAPLVTPPPGPGTAPVATSGALAAPSSPGSPEPPASSAAVPSGAAAPGGAALPGGADAPSASIVVDVTGRVRRPGIATLPTGSRVVDALRAAGGARRGARLGGLNLARVLTDGEQVVVGVPAAAGPAAAAATAVAPGSTTGSTSPATPLVNINTATAAQLEELPGVGPVTARAILDFRAEHGTFTAVDELLEVSGIGDATLAELAPFVTL